MSLKTIQFVDYGQDYLQFDLNDRGVVVDVRPTQAWAWKGAVITNHTEIERGSYAKFKRIDGHAGLVEQFIAYPVEAVSQQEVAHGSR
jgi:hypothetical protein